MRLVFFVLAAVLVSACNDGEATVSACADAILGLNQQEISQRCDSLPRDDQDKAAKAATDKSGVIVFFPPYEAKAAREGKLP